MASNIKMFYGKSEICKLDENKRDRLNIHLLIAWYLYERWTIFSSYLSKPQYHQPPSEKKIYSKYKHEEDESKEKVVVR